MAFACSLNGFFELRSRIAWLGATLLFAFGDLGLTAHPPVQVASNNFQGV
jgi:hypothetical protein